VQTQGSGGQSTPSTPSTSPVSSGGGGAGVSGGPSSPGTSSPDTSLAGGGAVSVSQSLADATQEAVEGRSIPAEQTCADGKRREQYAAQNDENYRKCESPTRHRQQAYGSGAAQPVLAKAAPAPVETSVGYNAWSYGFGDYEVHQNVAPNSGSDVTRRTATAGALGGFDVTWHGIASGTDHLMLGFMSGYSSATLTFGDALNTRMQMSGTTVGGYAKYFNGPFWNETIVKTDLFNLTQDQFAPRDVSSSTTMDVYTVAHNVSYRFSYGAVWWEPTAGAQYLSTQYGGNAASLFLSDGYDWRIQGGARTGTSFPWNQAIVSTTLTGLAYSDVIIRGFALDNGLAPTALPADEGKLRGQGILMVNLDFSNGVGVFAQGDVRGGQDLLAGGGRLGMRVAW
jgi:hypothetical protein